jgi:two-component system, NtrC family, sensor kinase
MSLKDHLIIYVDDERPNRVVFEQSFKDRFRLKVVASGAEALELLRSEEAAVLITDQRMPEMTGHELLVQTKRAHPDTIRMVITAYSDLDPILKGVNEGLVARYIVKPWDRAELEQMLVWALDAYRLGREDSALQVRLMRTERLATLGSISSALVHDLTQPLASLDHNCDRLGQLGVALKRAMTTRGAKGSASPELVELAAELGEIAEESKRSCTLMLQMTDSIRQFGRPVTSTEKPVCEPRQVIRQVLALTRDLAIRRDVKLVYDGLEELPAAAISSVELTQILMNLVINATQAIELGGHSGRVVLVAAISDAQIELTVSDDGVGMTAEGLRRAGTLFFTTKSDGSGLGLAQCFRLVGRAGGTIALRSTLGEGTVVTVKIPRSDDPREKG